MLTRAFRRGWSSRDERGFTLVEMLAVLVSATVVMGALFTIIDTTLNQTSRSFTKVDATGRARTTIESIENELHSACVASGITPIQSNSSNTSLLFASQYGTASTPTPVEHQITFNAATGTLTDTTYASNGGEPPDWTYSTTPTSTTTLLTNVSAQVVGGVTTPVFQYYAYQEPKNSQGAVYTDADGNPYMMLLDGTTPVPGTNTIPAASPLTVPLSTTDAQNASEVVITLVVGASGGTGERTGTADANDTVTDSVVLRLTPAGNNADSGTNFSPCQ